MKFFIILFGLISVTLSCDFTCPNSKPPERNPNFTPTPNGCGPKLSIPTSWLPSPEFERCCDAHDRCYGRCNSGKSNCDDNFLDCMLRTCSDLKCEEYAYIFNDAVRGYLGCHFYKSGQEKACLCK